MGDLYSEIRERSKQDYGQKFEEWAPRILVDQYSDRTHFIFELIQNAEDAGATYVAFSLYQDRLILCHNGKLFTEADIQGICGIRSTKDEPESGKIGRFGIGFKSVYDDRLQRADASFFEMLQKRVLYKRCQRVDYPETWDMYHSIDHLQDILCSNSVEMSVKAVDLINEKVKKHPLYGKMTGSHSKAFNTTTTDSVNHILCMDKKKFVLAPTDFH